ncbi:MAG: hypothetical protein Q9218_003674, partial [Villophora microphyllina]
ESPFAMWDGACFGEGEESHRTSDQEDDQEDDDAGFGQVSPLRLSGGIVGAQPCSAHNGEDEGEEIGKMEDADNANAERGRHEDG